VPARSAADLFRLPVDRVFTVKGTGTVVTGTVWSGVLEKEHSVRLLPLDRLLRIRGLQAHSTAVDRVQAGDRAAIALAGVELDEVHRGMVLVRGDGWAPTRIVRADLTLLDPLATAISPRTWLRFHLGTQEVGARVIRRGDAATNAVVSPVRIVLDSPVVARAGDRFVLRSASPSETIGGGIITDPQAPPRARPWQRANVTRAARGSTSAHFPFALASAQGNVTH
jgi:selenocysteine-specific elongation factor